MKTVQKTWILYFSLVLLTLEGLVAQVRPFTPRYSNASVRGNIKFISNNSITTNSTSTTDAPPSGSATNNGNYGVNLDIDNVTTTIIPWNSTWKFCDSGYAPGTGTWMNSSFADATWLSATAGLPSSAQRDIGYGDGDEVTPYIYAGCGARPAVQLPGCGTKYWTTYFRRQVNIPSVAAYSGFTINLHRDDGAVVYVNGVEVARSNLPTGTILYNTPAPSSVDGTNEDVTFTIGTGAFVNGTNTIAVEIHQNAQTSSDVSFRLELIGQHPSLTFNATSADLNLNSCSEVLWAGLYWGSTLGGSSDSSWRSGRGTVLVKVPGAASYTTVTSTQTEIHDSSAANNHTGYQSFADITSLFNTLSPNGTYTVANVAAPVSTGRNNQAAGWTIVVVFKDPTTIPRNLVVFDGFEIVSVNTQKDVPIAGFLTPLSGPVSCELGAVMYDGDRGSSDGFYFKQDSAAAGVYTNLSNTGTSGNNDSWNSTISYMGANVTTRNPAHANTLGYDADIIQLPNPGNAVLGNNRTSARIRISSPSGGENFFLHVVTSAVSVFNPSFNLVKSATDLSGGTWQPGDSLQYKLVNTNNGVDTSTLTTIIDTLPATVIYKPGTLRINNTLKTDAAGDDEAEYDPIGRRVIFRIGIGANSGTGGQVYPGTTDSASFVVNAVNSCQILSCNNTASNQAIVVYAGKNSSQNLSDYSGYINGSGCYTQGSITNTIVGTCTTIRDTSLVNQCPLLSTVLPASSYNGYNFYSAMPFISGNLYNVATPITSSGTYYAYYNAGVGCSDTVRFIVLIQPCPDIDDDDDGIPDYVESNGADAFADNDSDGQPNFTDSSYPGFVDSNSDGVNDNFDSDKDGIPNQIDLDSDNDGIPDVVESGGTDQDGNGRIDNFSDTDNDGLSQNVDANNSGQAGSGNGLGIPDLDNDGIPNYIDLDSDNDGIPDVKEVFGADANNDGIIDSYTDVDTDGYSDNVDGDVGNDGSSENTAASLLRTGADLNGDGRAESYPFKNFDSDSRPNAYDIDSDNDGLSDVREAGFSDIDNNGFSDGVKGGDGWDNSISALSSITLLNTDAGGNPDYLDIDADNDGIPDNIEGVSTMGYYLPSGLDADGDGLDNSYDGVSGFGGNGFTPNDQDVDGIPDYRDADSDNDALADIVEGNDFNLNGIPDDLVTLTGVDTDGDGLDDRFDNNNSSVEGTSSRMGNAGTYVGDPSPGSTTTVQSFIGGSSERDWRMTTYVLDASFINLSSVKQNDEVKLNWLITCEKIIDHFDIERSVDGMNYSKIGEKAGLGVSCKLVPFAYSDYLNSPVQNGQYYYRIKAVSVNGTIKYSGIVTVKIKPTLQLQISPNPASNRVNIGLMVDRDKTANLVLIDAGGKLVSKQTYLLRSGYNTILVEELNKLPNGVYNLLLTAGSEIYTEKLVIRN